MKTPTPTKRQPRPRSPSRDELFATAALIALMSAGREGGSLRVDWPKLDLGEQFELVGLGKRVRTKGGHDLAVLDSKELRRFEALLEKGAGLDAGFFKREKEGIAMKRQIEELARRARKPSPRPVLEEEGSVTLSRETVFDFPNRPQPVLWLEHVGLLTILLGWFENGEAPASGSRFEGEGEDLVLLIDSQRFGVGRYGVDGIPGWKTLLEHLVENRYFMLAKHGKDWRVKLGPRSLSMRSGPKTRAVGRRAT